MKNSNSESLEKKALSDKEINSDSSSEKTDDEIIYNNCIDPEEEEFLVTEKKSETNIPEENNNISEKIQPQNNLLKHTSEKSCKNKFHDYYSPKFDFARKKRNKPEEVKTADDLFVEALEKKSIASANKRHDKQGNNMSTKISDKIYDKYVGQNCLSGDIIDIAKMKDEESNIKRDALKARENARKINDMISRQEKYETYKKNRLKERKQLYNDKINQECVFMPNGVNLLYLTKSPKDFFANEIKFLEKKKEFIQKENKTILEEEKKRQKVALLNKTSEKLASNKNPNESKEQLYQRLHFEKLKNVKIMYKKPEHEKKITKKQANNLINKLYKERLTLKENKEKKQQEIILKETNQDEHISENSNKVLLTKFLNYYNNTLQKIFNRNDNFQINIDEYKLILQHMGCIKLNLQSDEALIKESFFNILNPKDDKIDTYTLLLFCLAALGIYKGNDDKKIFESIDTYKYNNYNNNNNKPKQNSLSNSTRLSGRKSQKIKTKSFNDLIKLNIPNLDMDKFGFSSKIAKNINKKFHTFVKGINESWTGDITKKKQERYEKYENSNQKVPRASSQNKKSTLRNLDNNTKLEINLNQKNNGKNNTIPINSKNFDELYKRLNQKKEKNNLKCYKNKKELEEMGPCTFQPNVFKSANKNSKEKNRNKLNSKQIDQNFEKLYQEGKASYLQKKKYSVDPDPEDNLENQINCTFKPEIHQFNNEVFINNPIKDELKKFEKIREQRLSDIANKEFEKTMNFVIEPKINKEDIIDRVVPERFSYKNNINYSNNNNNNDFIEKENEVDNALLKVEVNLDENNNTDKIIIYPGDDVKEKTLKFCQKHKLNEEKKNTLMNIIMEKIEETKNGISEEKNEENNNVNDMKNNGEENGSYEYIIEKKENNDEN